MVIVYYCAVFAAEGTSNETTVPSIEPLITWLLENAVDSTTLGDDYDSDANSDDSAAEILSLPDSEDSSGCSTDDDFRQYPARSSVTGVRRFAFL